MIFQEALKKDGRAVLTMKIMNDLFKLTRWKEHFLVQMLPVKAVIVMD